MRKLHYLNHNAKTQRRKGLEPVDHPPQTLNQPGCIEVQQQAKVLVHEPEIGQQLCKMYRQDFLDCLDFHDDFVLDQQTRMAAVMMIREIRSSASLSKLCVFASLR